MSEKTFSFRVNFRPKESWVDEIFLGNLLAEVLGNVAKSTNAFDFDVKKLGQESAESSDTGSSSGHTLGSDSSKRSSTGFSLDSGHGSDFGRSFGSAPESGFDPDQ